MRRGVAIALAAGGLLAAAPAGAETTRATASRGAATCLRDAGAGLLSLTGGPRRGVIPVVLTAAADPALAPAPIALGPLTGCPAAAAQPSGAAVVAASGVTGAGTPAVLAAARGPGAAFGDVRVLGRGDGSTSVQAVSSAVGGDGSAAVAWALIRTRQTGVSPFSTSETVEYRLARRSPTGTWSPSERLGAPHLGSLATPRTAVAVAADGTVTVAFTPARPDRRHVEGLEDIDVATAPPGRAVGAPQRLFADAQDVDPLALASSSTGDTVLATTHNGVLDTYERAAATAPWSILLRAADDAADIGEPSSPALAMGDGGRLLVGWEDEGVDTLAIRAATRAAPGSLAAPVTVAAARESSGLVSGSFTVFGDGGTSGPPVAPSDDDEDRLTASLGSDDRTLLAWRQGGRVRSVLGTLVRPGGRRVTSGSPCRTPGGATALTGRDGAVRLAYTEDSESGGLRLPAERDGVLHASAVPEADAAAAALRPPPAAAVSLPRRVQRPIHGGPIALRVRCARACDVSASARPRPTMADFGPADPAVTTQRVAGGALAHIALQPDPGAQFAGRVVARVAVCAQDGTHAQVHRVVLRVEPRPPRLPVAVEDLAASRVGHRVRVTWTTPRRAFDTAFEVLGRTQRHSSGSGALPLAIEGVKGLGRRRFQVVLRATRTIRYVALVAVRVSDGTDGPIHVVRVG